MSMSSMKTWKCTAKEITYHEWTIEARSESEARDIASVGCPNYCTSKEKHIEEVTVKNVTPIKTEVPK